MPTLAVAFYGKIVSEPDFVRINAGAFQRAGWDAWLQEALTDVQRLGLDLPAQPVKFVLAGSRGRVCLGAFAPGRDALARSFPAVLSIETAAPAIDAFAFWRHRQESFFTAAGALAAQASRLAATELAARMLSLGSRLDAEASPLSPELWTETSLAQVSQGEDRADFAYGLTTTVAACAEARNAKPGQPSRVLTLHGHSPTEIQRSFWIELVCRHLGQSPPSLLWTEQALVLSLGSPPPAALTCLVAPERAGARSWPLRTFHPAARAAALARLTPAQAHVLGSPGASLAHVLSVFSREPL